MKIWASFQNLDFLSCWSKFNSSIAFSCYIVFVVLCLWLYLIRIHGRPTNAREASTNIFVFDPFIFMVEKYPVFEERGKEPENEPMSRYFCIWWQIWTSYCAAACPSLVDLFTSFGLTIMPTMVSWNKYEHYINNINMIYFPHEG
jgi:hypothetical protein